MNMRVEWRHDGIDYEADPRHAEIIVSEIAVANATPEATAGKNMSALPEEDDPLLNDEHAHKFRSVIDRWNYPAQDKIDIRYAVRETARGMALF